MNPSFELSIFAVPVVTDPKVLIEGVLFRARYLGSTQLVSFFPAQFFIVFPQNLLPPILPKSRHKSPKSLPLLPPQVCEGQPTKATRMMQAEEAVSRIKV